MGAKPVLEKAPPPDRAERLCCYPEYKITEIAPDGEVYFGCFDGLTIVCTASRTWTR